LINEYFLGLFEPNFKATAAGDDIEQFYPTAANPEALTAAEDVN